MLETIRLVGTMGVSSLLFFIVIVSAYFIAVFIQQRNILKGFRGPVALPMLGNCYVPEAVVFLKYLGTLRKKYGKIFTFFSFAKGYLVVSDPIIARRVLSDLKTFPKGADYTNKFGYVFGEGLVTSNGEKHKRDRAIFGKYFVRTNLAKQAITINTMIRETFQEYLTIPPGEQTFIRLNIEHVFAKVAFRTFMKFAMNVDLRDREGLEDYICTITSQGSNAVGRIILFNLPLWDIIPETKLLSDGLKFVRPLCSELIETRKTELLQRQLNNNNNLGEEDELDDCLSAMLREQLPEKEMIDHILTLLTAGHDTTAFFIAYLVYLLAIHPEEQDKLYTELTTTFTPEVLATKECFTADEIASLPYLQCVMMETLRYFAIIPCLTREVAEDVTLEGSSSNDCNGKKEEIMLPKGATIMIPIVVMNRDSEVYDMPNEFRPSRFLVAIASDNDNNENKGNKKLRADFTCAKDGYFPFGYGARTCIGNYFAQLESGILVCHLLTQFQIQAEPSFHPQIRSGISLTTTNGIYVQLHPRHAHDV